MNKIEVTDYSKLLGKMKEKGITQSELAKQIGISETSLNKKLNGGSQFRQEEMLKILDCIGVNIESVSLYFFAKKLVKSQGT